jgi:succinate dehydrogenase / fumarate reductase cytochrome b subunit
MEAPMKRPVFFNVFQIRMPVGAVTSILHRITGIFLAIGIGFGVYLLDRSLRDPQSYAWVSALFTHAAFKMAALAFAWALAHHLLAGIRHLLSDIDIGSSLPAARRSAWCVNLGALAVTLLAAGALL